MKHGLWRITLFLLASGCATPSAVLAPATVAGADGSILGLTEHDEDGGETALERAVRFIDANSRIDVRIDRAALRAALPAELLPEGIDEELERLRELQALAVRALADTDSILAASAAYADDPRRVDELVTALQTSAERAVPLLEEILTPGHPLSVLEPALNARLERSATAGGYRELFEVVGEHSAEQLRRIDAELTGFAVLLEARLLSEQGARNLHLPGFDEYPAGESFRVERWQYAPSPEQQAALEDLKTVAEQLNAGNLSLRRLLRQEARNALVGLEAGARRCLDEARAGLERLSAAPALAAQVGELAGLLADVRALKQHLRELSARYLEVPPESLALERFPTDLRDTVARLRSLGSSLNALLEGLQPTLDALAPELRALRDELLTCAGTLVTELGPLGDGLLAYFGERLEILRQAELPGEYGARVLRHSLAALPEQTELDLVTTGARALGERLVFRIGCVRVDSDATARSDDVRTLEERRFELAQVLVHTEAVVTLGFLDPNGTAGLAREWQAVPAFSVLFKQDSRESPFWNRILDPGLGVMVAAPDFDGDDSTELGLGVVLSFLRDYVQVGYGYDFEDDRWFGFFGLGLPLSQVADGIK